MSYTSHYTVFGYSTTVKLRNFIEAFSNIIGIHIDGYDSDNTDLVVQHRINKKVIDKVARRLCVSIFYDESEELKEGTIIFIYGKNHYSYDTHFSTNKEIDSDWLLESVPKLRQIIDEYLFFNGKSDIKMRLFNYSSTIKYNMRITDNIYL